MPYELEKASARCWIVKNVETGKVHAKCTTKTKAQKQLALLRGVEHGWTPTGKKSTDKGKGVAKPHYPKRVMPYPLGVPVASIQVKPQKQETFVKLDPKIQVGSFLFGNGDRQVSRSTPFSNFVNDDVNMNPKANKKSLLTQL